MRYENGRFLLDALFWGEQQPSEQMLLFVPAPPPLPVKLVRREGAEVQGHRVSITAEDVTLVGEGGSEVPWRAGRSPH